MSDAFTGLPIDFLEETYEDALKLAALSPPPSKYIPYEKEILIDEIFKTIHLKFC